MTPDAKNSQGLLLTRVLDAPQARAFRAWTDPEELAQWWGPDGFTTPVCEVDARPGGSLYIEMRGPEGSGFEGPYPMWGTVVEIDEPKRIVFSAVLKNDGKVFLETLDSVALDDVDGKTRLTLEVRVVTAGPEAAGPLEGMPEGWKQSLERLAAFVAVHS
jgi:uncharacterized protein YndB with AHSA1/START domain